MTIELILSSLSVGISLVSGFSSVFLYVRYLKNARGFVRNIGKDEETSGEGSLYIIGISGRL